MPERKEEVRVGLCTHCQNYRQVPSSQICCLCHLRHLGGSLATYILEERYVPSLVIEKVWLVSLDDDYIKEVPPVFPNYELHASVPAKANQLSDTRAVYVQF